MTQAFPPGSVKQDPETKAVAVRVFDGKPGDWLVVDLDHGGHYTDVKEAETVLAWPDLQGKPAPAKATRRAKTKG